MSAKRDEYAWLTTGSLVILAAVAIAMVLRYTSFILIPFVLAAFIVSMVSPLLDLLVLRLRLPRSLAVVVTLLIVLVFITFLTFLVIQAVQTVVATATQYSDSFANLAGRVFPKLKDWGLELDQQRIIGDLRAKIPAFVANTAGRLLNLLSSLFFIVIFVIFLLSGRDPRVVRRGVYADIDHNVRRYIATKVLISALTGVLVWATLAALGLKLAEVFGIFAFLLNFIPSIGSIVATLLPIPIAVAQFQNPWYVVLVVAVPGAIQMTIGNFIEPKLMGTGLNLHPVTVLLALSFWGLLWGLTGMFLAAPMTAVIRIILMQFDTLRPVGNLLAGRLPPMDRPSRSEPV